MQEKINSFNAAFVDLAAGYVNRVAIRAAQKEPEPKGAAQQFRHELANEIQLANLLAATIGKMQAASGGEFPQDEQEDGKPHTAAGNMEFLRDFLEGKTRWNFPEGTVFNVNTSTGDGAAVQLKPEADGEPEPPERPEPVVKLGPGASFRLENTPIHGQYPAPDGVKVDAVERLQNLCSFCKEMECYRSGDSMDMVAGIEGRARVIYEVRGGRITVKGKQLKANLADGLYIIRRLTVLECKRLQTVPDSYIFPVSDTQAYRQLGNGWTVDVIAHILSFCPGIKEKPLEVLSMYDGMSCGRLALDKLGARVAAYWATEIDKYAIKTTQANFPDTVQLGDAFQVREDGWKPWEGAKQ